VIGLDLLVRHEDDLRQIVAQVVQQKAEAEARAATEAKARQAAIARAEALAKELRGGAEKPVDASDMEAEVRRVPDLTYDAGL